MTQYESLNIQGQAQGQGNLNIDMTNFKTSILNAIMRNNTILTSSAWRNLPDEQKHELIKNALIEVATTTPRLGTMGFQRGIKSNWNAFKTNASNAIRPSTWRFGRTRAGGRRHKVYKKTQRKH
jgi:hypothetical protein